MASHDVVVNTIAATTTRTGLTVHAELDPNPYPTGVKISKRQLDALPITRHLWHGNWNYTLRPEPSAPSPARRPQGGRDAEQPDWAHPALTGIQPRDWAQLVDLLIISYPAQRDTDLYLHRGGSPLRASQRGHASSALTVSEKALATVLRQRFAVPVRTLAALFGVTHPTIATAERQLKPLLERHCRTIAPTGTRLRTLADLTAFAAHVGVPLTPKTKPAR